MNPCCAAQRISARTAAAPGESLQSASRPARSRAAERLSTRRPAPGQFGRGCVPAHPALALDRAVVAEPLEGFPVNGQDACGVADSAVVAALGVAPRELRLNGWVAPGQVEDELSEAGAAGRHCHGFDTTRRIYAAQGV